MTRLSAEFNLPTTIGGSLADSDVSNGRIVCCPSSPSSSVSEASNYATLLLEFLSQTSNAALLGSHPTEFFTGREAWRGALPVMESAVAGEKDVLNWLRGDEEDRVVDDTDASEDPNHLAREWFRHARRLAMPREAVSLKEIFRESLDASLERETMPSSNNAPIEPFHTGRKKAHELERFSELIGLVAKKTAARRVVDAGAGLGRLGRTLASKLGLDVLGVERDSGSVERVGKRAESENVRSETKEDEGNVEVSSRVVVGELDASSLPRFATLTDPPTILVGLHACGDLTVDMCRAFVAPGSLFRGLVVAGCCHQLSSSFPLSTTVRTILEQRGLNSEKLFSKRALEAAAQSAGANYLGSQSVDARRMIRTKAVARGFLELLHSEIHLMGRGEDCRACRLCSVGSSGADDVKERDPESKPRNTSEQPPSAPPLVGKFPYDPRKSFANYAATSLGPESANQLARNGDLDTRFQCLLDSDGALYAGFTAMRHALGAVAESLIVLDRALFLVQELERKGGEGKFEVRVVPLFDPAVSPRNLVVVALR